MGQFEFVLDQGGIAEVLSGSGAQAAVTALANEIANAVRGQGITVSSADEELPVVVDSYTTDRAAASVTIAHPAGRAVQAKYGALSRAAAAVGLEVKSR